MRISFSPKAIEGAPKDFVRVDFVEGGTTKLVREGGVETLEIRIKKQSDINRRKLRILCRQIIQVAKQQKIKKVAIQWDRTNFTPLAGTPYHELAVDIAAAFEMANYEPTTYKTKPKDGWRAVDEVLLCGDIDALDPKGRDGYKKGQLIGQQVNACRELCNMPGGDMTPKVLASAAKAAVKGTAAKVKIFGRADMQKLGMGAVLGIAKGSAEEPKFIIIEYWGAGKLHKLQRSDLRKPIVLVGKGVTFDTGGLQIKPGDHMYEMHMDMSGGAAVIHTVALAAKLKLKRNIVALVPAVENAPGQNAVRPGDILKSLSGKTIEILHTDAEGRVILADAITYAKRYEPRAVVDVATLTGASLTALGVQASAFMFNQDEVVPTIMEYAEASGDYMWPFPSWEEYEDMTKGTFGDVPNISTAGNSRYGGVIAGGMFLKEFAKDLKCLWIHVDMAPRMTSAPNEHLAKGAAGAPVRFLLEFIEKYGNGAK